MHSLEEKILAVKTGQKIWHYYSEGPFFTLMPKSAHQHVFMSKKKFMMFMKFSLAIKILTHTNFTLSPPHSKGSCISHQRPKNTKILSNKLKPPCVVQWDFLRLRFETLNRPSSGLSYFKSQVESSITGK